jgi:YVTN family beta-propeller protein
MTVTTRRRNVCRKAAIATLMATVFLLSAAAPMVAPTHGGMADRPLMATASAAALLSAQEPSLASRIAGLHSDLTPPSVQNTVVLFNGSLVGGNFQAGWAIDPVAVAVDTVTDEIFTAAQYPFQLSVAQRVSGFDTEVVGNVTLPSMPDDLVYDPADATIYVTEHGIASVAAVNGTTLAIDAQIPVGTDPEGIAYDSTNGDLYVANSGSNNVTVINGSTNRTVGSGIPVGVSGAGAPFALAFDGTTDQMFVADSSWPSHTSMPVEVINDSSDQVASTVYVGDEPVALAYDSLNDEMFVANEASGNLSAISDSTDTVAATYLGYSEPDGLAYVPAQQDVDVANGGSNNVSTLNPGVGYILWNTSVGTYPRGITETQLDGSPYPIVANYGSANVSVLDPGSGYVDLNIRLTQTPQQVAYDPFSGQNELFVVESLYEGTVSIINDTANHFDPDGYTSNVGVGHLPIGIVFDPTDGEMFVSNSGSDTVSVIDCFSSGVVATIPVGSEPWGLAWDGPDREVWVANAGSANVSVIDAASNRVVANIALPTGSDPEGIAYDSSTGFVYVTESNESRVALLNASSDAVSEQVGSGQGGSQAVYDSTDSLVYTSNEASDNLTAYAQSTSTNAHVVANSTVPNGPNGLAYDPATDELFVAQSSSDTVDVVQPSTESVSTNFTVGSAPIAMAVDTGHQTLYVNNQLEGTTSIAPIPLGTSTPTQEFDESGLPSGAIWYINISGQSPLSSTINGGAGTSIIASLAAAGYTFTAATNSKEWTTSAGGAFTVSSTANSPIAVPFTAVTFPVYANETGLPIGASWYFNITGEPSDSSTVALGSGSATVVNLPNGSYPWSIATNWLNYSTTSSAGTITVNGGPANVTVLFTESSMNSYAVTFNEVGLPAGVTWYLNVTGENGRSATVTAGGGPSISMTLANGTYAFSASTNEAAWTWNSSLTGTSATVSGAPIAVPVYFEQRVPPPAAYQVVFSENGLPTGDEFTVVVDTQTLTDVAPAPLMIVLANGSYTYSVSNDPPYVANETGGTVVVQGHPETIAISFSNATSTPSTNSSSGNSLWIWIAVLVVVIVAALLLLFLVARRRKKKAQPASASGNPPQPSGGASPPTTAEAGGTAR